MSEGLRKRMAVIVGDENSVGRYLAEKVGHTSAIAWTLACVEVGRYVPDDVRVRVFVVALVIAALAVLTYDVVGKVLWLRSCWTRAHSPTVILAPRYEGEPPREIEVQVLPGAKFTREDGAAVDWLEELRDTIVDAWLGGFTIAAAFAILGWVPMLAAFAVWLVVIAVASNNQWARPI